MAQKRFQTLRAVLAPRAVKTGVISFALLGAYDVLSSQFELPTLGALVGWGAPALQERFAMTGALLPWWGWLLIIQAIFVYGLFEYVRRNIPARDSGGATDGAIRETRQSIQALERDVSRIAYSGIIQTTLELLDELIVTAPSIEIPIEANLDSDRREETYGEVNNYIRLVISTFEGTHRGSKAVNVLARSESNVDHRLGELLGQRPELNADLPNIRRYLIADEQRKLLIAFLKYERLEIVGNVRVERQELLDLYQRRNPN